MAEGDNLYRFLPWYRSGIARRIVGGQTRRGEVTLEFNINVNNEVKKVSTPAFSVYSAGDIHGIDPNLIKRVWPEPDGPQAEENYFPLLEFHQPDFPWRYTPAAADTKGRLLPWLCLIALKDEEFVKAPSDSRLPGAITVTNPKTPLPILSQAWAWAHVQVSGFTLNPPGSSEDDLSRDEVRKQMWEYLEKYPERGIARLLCPRRLDTRTAYTVFLVPTLLQGVRAGLGQPFNTQDAAMKVAWEVNRESEAAPLTVPYYHKWRFQTGSGGDFQTLVAQLKGRVLPKEVGTRSIDVLNPGSELPAVSDEEVRLPGALKPAIDLRNPTLNEEWITQITTMLNGRSAAPMYGRWHAAERVETSPSVKEWFHRINVDPRFRIAAALGTAIVQSQQQALMASAWQQVEGIREINDELRRAQLSRELSVRLFDRHINAHIDNQTDRPLDVDSVLIVTAPLFRWLRCGNLTSSLAINTFFDLKSRIPNGLTDAQWRRASRPFGPIGRRQQRDPSIPSNLFQRFARGEIVLDPPPPPRERRTDIITWPRDPGLTRNLQLRIPEPPLGEPTLVEYEDPAELDWARFHEAATQLFTALETVPQTPREVVEAEVIAIAECMLGSIQPRALFDKMFDHTNSNSRLKITSPDAWQAPDDKLAPIWAAPTFPQPMFGPLRDLSQDWVLPGLEHVPPDTVAALKPNTAFIEAYMVGLNHEMARELRWHGFATDQRGSYFRNFWDSSAFPEAAAMPVQQTADIAPLHTWEEELGSNRNLDSFAADVNPEAIVLLIRGELLRRYPKSDIYAVKATWKNDDPQQGRIVRQSGGNIAEDDQKHSVFSGTLFPDVSFFRFDLDETTARGVNGDAGWFFVVQEPKGDIRFGLDQKDAQAFDKKPATWHELAWQHLAADQTAFDAIGYIDLDKPAITPTSPSTSDPAHLAWNTSNDDAGASNIAWITWQKPVRVAIHARRLLP